MPHDAEVAITASTLVLENARVRRVLEKENKVWLTRAFARADGIDLVQVQSEEFLILLMDGTALTAGDYQAHENPSVMRNDREALVRIAYVLRKPCPGAPRTVQVEYRLGSQPYLRKRLILEMADGEAVDRLEVERFWTRMVCDLGGIGEPVFIGGSWFAGLEYPGSYAEYASGLVTLAHFPGYAKPDADGDWRICSKSAVLGTGQSGDPLELAFGDYLDTIRRPAPRHVLVNTWMSSVRTPGSIDDLMSFFDAYHRKLQRCGVQLDSLQPDLMGWEPETLSRPRKDIFPEGYRPLRGALAQRGSTLSLWLALNGTGNLSRRFPGVERTARWLEARGIKRAQNPFQDFDGHFCVSVPAYAAMMRETLRDTMADGDIAYFKHDFVQVACGADGHGHLPTIRHGMEANTDTLLDFMAWERELKPEILLAPTSYVWPSPWWLTHANYLWYCASDSGAVSSWPQKSNPEWEMNYHDGHFYKLFHAWRHQVPMSAFNTQAFLRHTRPDQDTLRDWTDYAMMACGRGLRLMDLYFEPSDLSEVFWQALGESLRWWQDHLDVLGTTRMVGGNPHQGEVYGYAHWCGERGILCLRNPDVREQAVRVPFDKTVRYRGETGRPFRGRVIYPYVEELPAQFTSGQPLLLSVPGYTVMLIELEPGTAPEGVPAAPAGSIEGGGSIVCAQRDWTQPPADDCHALTARVWVRVPDEDMARCELFLVARSVGALPEFPLVAIDGRPAAVHSAEGSGDTPARTPSEHDTDAAKWALRCIDLQPFRGQAVEVTAASAKNPVPFMLDAWLVADRPVAFPAIPPDHSLPPTFWHHVRRQTVRLCSYRLSVTPLHH
jgi:hypothetical protein